MGGNSRSNGLQARRSRPRRSGGTRMSALASRLPRRRFRALTSVRAYSFHATRGYTQTSAPDKKCPFTGEVSIRGRILTGRVVSTKMTRTLIIRRDYLHYIPKYSTYACVKSWRIFPHLGPFFSNRPLREAPQEPCSARITSLPCGSWRRCHCW